jgi:RNA polymerase sigma-70 factor (ECF subfamily)
MFERYYREILSFLSGKVADRAMAADLAQESYARAYAAQGTGDDVNNPRAMLYRIARNLVIDHHRHAEVRGAVEMPACDEQAALARAPRSLEPEVAAVSRQGVMALAQAIDHLPPRCREAFMLNRFDGLSYAEVAGRMGISVKMVEQHISNALDACARCHQDAAPEPRRKMKRPRAD